MCWEPVQRYIRKSLFQLILHPTFRCNASCRFCFNAPEINKKRGKELTLQELEIFSSSLPKFYWLLLSGGEPILRKDLSAIVRVFYRKNGIRHISLPSNGISGTALKKAAEEILASCPEATLTVAISLDAIGKEHDRIRETKGCFDKAVETYRSLGGLRKNPRFNIKINTVLSKENLAGISEVVSFVRDLRPDMHSIELVRGSWQKPSPLLPEKDDLPKAIDAIKRNHLEYGTTPNVGNHSLILKAGSRIVQRAYLRFLKETLAEGTQVLPCKAYQLSLVLYAYGNISFCEMDPPFANIRDHEHDYMKIIKSVPALQRKASIRNKDCHCYHPCHQYINILHDPPYIAAKVLQDAF
jgi:MoaA/NifB/PqqE/SkfB family radical SAM enzyme